MALTTPLSMVVCHS